MSQVFVQSSRDGASLGTALATAPRIALDCEAAGFHRYSDQLCLVQLTVEHETFVVDPLAFDPADLLRESLEDPAVTVLMHGADFDLRLLRRDLGIGVRGLFDTQIVAELLGKDALGLAALLEAYEGVRLSKKYQRADWAKRPLTDAMLEYAADDTRYLSSLAGKLEEELVSKGRTAWAEEEFRALEEAATAPPAPGEPEDPVSRIKGARKLSPRQVTAVREALLWRDEIARARDRAPFRVIGDGPLLEAVAAGPRQAGDLTAVKGFPSRLAREDGRGLVQRLQRVRELPDGELRPYPKGGGRGGGRPTPEVMALADRLKAVRNRRSEDLGLPRGTLLSNAVVLELARLAPRDLEAMVAVEGMRRWKTELLGAELLAVIRAEG